MEQKMMEVVLKYYGTILSEQDYELWKMREQIEKFVENHKVKTVM